MKRTALRPLLCLELCYDFTERSFVLHGSLPHRESVLMYRWRAPDMLLDAEQVADMSSTIDRLMIQAGELYGTQLRFPAG